VFWPTDDTRFLSSLTISSSIPVKWLIRILHIRHPKPEC
jgi:hypothetical protein